jgi:hypothetical protein
MHLKIPRLRNLKSGDIGLWYDVQAYVNGEIVHHVCPYDVCSSFAEAETYYYKNFYRHNHVVIRLTHHKLSKKLIYQMLSIKCSLFQMTHKKK